MSPGAGSFADLCAKAVQTELHPGVVSAAKWAATRLGRDVPYRPSTSIIADKTSGLTFIRVPGMDSFRRGADPDDPYHLRDEIKVDKTLSISPFYLSTTEVTLASLAPFFEETVDTGVFGQATELLKLAFNQTLFIRIR